MPAVNLLGWMEARKALTAVAGILGIRERKNVAIHTRIGRVCTDVGCLPLADSRRFSAS
jgi:hypothetical protein